MFAVRIVIAAARPNNLGHGELEIRLEITGGLEFMDKLKLRSYGMFL